MSQTTPLFLLILLDFDFQVSLLSVCLSTVVQTPLWLVGSFPGFNNNTTTNPTLNRKKIKDNFKDDFGVVCKALSPPPKRPSTLSAMTSKLKPSSFQHRHELQFKQRAQTVSQARSNTGTLPPFHGRKSYGNANLWVADLPVFKRVHASSLFQSDPPAHAHDVHAQTITSPQLTSTSSLKWTTTSTQ